MGKIQTLHGTQRHFHFKQDNDEFLSIILNVDASILTAFISVVQAKETECTNSPIDVEMEAIMKDLLTFSDGTSFEEHFEDVTKLGENSGFNKNLINIF